ncbi:MAG: type II toxin-antitoxin system RelE/ParE family toxin [Methanocalculus sp. MSAO_Arc2]|uniref:type II toxin-antitoxin system RelE family toxin n=1 Tax=Methanocalculus sp. MSAO_Arc2 TaxID=2293855 RepID=UPI000FF7C321|nr:MAG: type II toxin-antitoxin system RelE/ParE family toxin [Methanocalculus sp. MSAO_Arc2]
MTFITEQARRNLRSLSSSDAERIISGLSGIKDDPYAHVKKLRTGSPTVLYSWRIGSYRAILTIEDEQLLVLVLEIERRRAVYRKV